MYLLPMFGFQKDMQILFDVEEFDEQRNENGLIDVIPLNLTPAIQGDTTKPKVTIGIYGLVNMTVTYRIERDIPVNPAVDKCTIIPRRVSGSRESEEVSIQEKDPLSTLTVSFSRVSPTCSAGVRLTEQILPLANETADCDCLTNEEATVYVAIAVSTTSLIMLMSFPLMYYMRRYWFTADLTPTGESILALILEKSMC